jgi:hypothetical protein
MTLIIESEESKRYLQEENAIDGFRVAVNNGQTRLALEVLVTIVDAFAEILSLMMQDDEDEEIVIVAPTVVEVQEKIEEIKPVEVQEAKKPAAKANASKEEVTTVSE